MSNYSHDLVRKAVVMKSDSSGGFPDKQNKCTQAKLGSLPFLKSVERKALIPFCKRSYKMRDETV